MKTGGINKKILIVVLTLLGVLCFSVLSVVVVNIIKQKNQTEDIQPSAYTFDDSHGRIEETSDDRYKNHTDFYITTPAGLNEFSVSVAYGCTFSGKNVYLSNDIDMAGWNYAPIGASVHGTDSGGHQYRNDNESFQGNFYGQNFTVRNINCTVVDRWSATAQTLNYGFFAKIKKATVTNLRLENVTFNDYDPTCNSYFGGIAGQSVESSIVNCKIKNLTINAKNNNSYAGGVVGLVEGAIATISTCAIDTYKINYSHADKYTTYFGGLIGMTTQAFTSDANVSMNLFSCYIANFSVSGNYYKVSLVSPADLSASLTSYYDGCDLDKVTATNTYRYNYIGFVLKNCGNHAAAIYKETIVGLNTTKNSATDLSYSNVGGASVNTTWYWAEEYNGGYPMLRLFIPWKTIYFNVSTGLSRTLEYAEVPSDEGLSYNINGATVTFFGNRTSVASNTGCCYSFTNWGFDGNVTFTAYSARNVGTIYFKYDSNVYLQTVWQDGSWSGDNGADLSHYFYCGETLYVTLNAYRAGVYSSVSMSFNGISVVYTWKSSSPYYISGLKVNGTLVTSNTVIHGTPTVELVLSLKTYTPSFQ